jgi:crotonobetainyl-CoA:carnitine CoA-transferase CaiB-like acyl-CoA transferase/enoyl-CoA hydratase/carnithine racemase
VTDSALSGIRVLDLTQVMAGPYCTMLLADLGADVVKIELPGVGDQTRQSWGRPAPDADSPAFYALNRNKRSVELDLRSAAGRETFFGLLRGADVLVENFRPGVTNRLGIDYPAVSAANPRLVYASITGFGDSGPYAQRAGYDLIAQGMAGAISITGEPAGAPVKCGLPVGDLGAGLFCAVAILAAHAHRQRTGRGQRVQTSLYEAVLAMSVWESVEYWATGTVPQRLGSANRMSAPYQALRTADGYLTVGANNERLWQRLCAAVGRPDLLEDPRFRTNADRMDHQAELAAALEAAFAAGGTGQWVTALLAAGVPAGPILDYGQVLGGDPHALARGMIGEVEHPTAGVLKVLGSPMKLSSTPATIRRAPPLLGQHTEEVLTGAGDAAADRRPDAGRVDLVLAGPVAHLTLVNPAKLNAISFRMYDELLAACMRLRDDREVRVVVLRGSGGRAFAAGTDIGQFAAFRDAADGVRYEHHAAEVLAAVGDLPMPVLAAVDGPAVGAGLALALMCDVVLATPEAVFGAPVARTLGNCLPPALVERLYAAIGRARGRTLLLTAGTLDAAQALAAGLVSEVVPREHFDRKLAELAGHIASLAPLTLAAVKEVDRRLMRRLGDVPADDLYATCYGSADFAEGVAAFLGKRPPRWTGR